MTYNWTEDRVEALKALWADGLSATQIAGQLGPGLTRNSVISKLHRLPGVPKRIATSRSAPGTRRPTPPKIRPASRLTPSSARIINPKSAPLPVEPPAPVVPLMLSLFQISDRVCKWPIGDPREREAFGFCGHPVAVKRYCAFHGSLAYQPADKRLHRLAAAAE